MDIPRIIIGIILSAITGALVYYTAVEAKEYFQKDRNNQFGYFTMIIFAIALRLFLESLDNIKEGIWPPPEQPTPALVSDIAERISSMMEEEYYIDTSEQNPAQIRKFTKEILLIAIDSLSPESKEYDDYDE